MRWADGFEELYDRVDDKDDLYNVAGARDDVCTEMRTRASALQ